MKQLIIIMLVFTLVLIGCSSTKTIDTSASEDAAKHKVSTNSVAISIDNSIVDAPSWFINPPEDNEIFYATGYAKMSDKQNSMKKAQMNAKTAMAEHLNTAVISLTDIYNSEGDWNKDMKDGGKNFGAFKDMFSSASMQSAEAFLAGAKREEVYFDAEGGCYVLMSISINNIQSQISNLAQGSGMSSDVIELLQNILLKQITQNR